MIKVVVTGAGGQVGQCLQSIADNYQNVSFLFLNSEELDITDLNAIQQVLKDNQPDYCINLAAYTAVDKAEDEATLAYAINGEGVKNLAEACKQYQVALIHLSTDFVFDGEKETPYLTNDQPNPINVYGSSKLKGEQYIQEIVDNFYIVRTSWLYSDFGNNFKKTMLRLAETRTEISVVNDQIGKPTNAVELAVFLMDLVQGDMPFGIYHYCGPKICSWYDFAVSIFEEQGIEMTVHPISSAEYPSKAIRPKYSVLS